MSWTVVVPTCRPEKFEEFLAAWEPLFKKHRAVLVVVQDSPEHFVKGDYRKFCWADIPEWIPRRADMIRSWGIYQAYLLGSDYTLTLDDDVV
ncbi:MAG TPA: hypothetical protein VLA89_00610, partial [Gemmatimonadales bacterium]|nr:hypothetical protein [Gemmatimonadales bacterium]